MPAATLLQKELGLVESSWYEASVQRPAPQPTLTGHWEADVGVIGGGYAGLSAALELAQRGFAVVLLEAQRLGWGASGRNGGQVLAGFGSDGEEAICHQLGAARSRMAWDVSVEAVSLLRERIARHEMACDWQPGALTVSVKPSRTRALRRWMEPLARDWGHPLQWIDKKDLPQWIASERFDAAVHDPVSGHLHPLKYCLELGRAAHGAGVRIFENSPALRLERGERPLVKTGQGELRCRHLILAGNVYLGEYGDALAPEISGRIMPVGTYMIATEAMDAARAKALIPSACAVSDNNFVLDYFRLSADHRLLFGAGDSYSGVTPRRLVSRIRGSMLRVFPSLADLSVTHAWGGFVDLTMNKAPDFGRLAPNIFYLQGFSGHGLAMAGMAGRLAAEAVQAQAERFDLFARLKHAHFPGGTRLRTPALVLGMLYYRLRDAL